MDLHYLPHQLTFKRPFAIAHGTRTHTPVVFVRIKVSERDGYGEASLPPYLNENQDSVIRFFRKAAVLLHPLGGRFDLEEVVGRIDALEEGNTAAKAALDMALHDLDGKIKEKPTHVLLGIPDPGPFLTAYTIPMDDEAGIRSRLAEASAYGLLKIKLGSGKDKAMIHQIRKFSPAPFFVDANEGWHDREQALDMAGWLAEQGCLFLEQPLARSRRDDIAWLNQKSPIPIMADESVQRFSDLVALQGVFAGINIKLMKCGGMVEAMKMIRWARANSMKVMMGCMSESSCAASAAAQVAPLADWTDLDGPLLIREDYFDGIKFKDGKVWLNDRPGLGLTPLPSLPPPVGK